jgi:hypothetical protein
LTPEARLRTALDALPAPVTLWWRDDDAGRDHPRLAALLALAEARGLPLALAVVPDWLEPAGAERILASPRATVLQHGIAHRDHAVAPARKIELGSGAAAGRLREALTHGRERLAATFGGRFRPVLVPPWNRIAPELVPDLPSLGFTGLSTWGPRPSAQPLPGLRQVNTHLDLVAWREGGRALELGELAQALAGLVVERHGEPIGVLSHHRVMDPAAFAALDRLWALVQDHPKVRLAHVETLFGEG